MKRVVRVTRGIGGALAIVGASFGTPAPAANAATGNGSRATPVARINGVALTQDALDASVALSRRLSSRATRQELKRRLIACELLRQAALKAERRKPGEGPGAPLTLSSAGTLVCSAREIRPYLLGAVRPAAVTDAEVRARYAVLRRDRSLPKSPAAQRQLGFEHVAAGLRSRMEAERLELAIRTLADQLIEEADIEQ